MSRLTITRDMTVLDVLDAVVGAIPLFQDHGVNPAGECAFFTRTLRLKDTPDRCHVDDLDELILELNAALQERLATFENDAFRPGLSGTGKNTTMMRKTK